MEALEHFLPQVWFVVLGLFLFLYVTLDGFDLGVGILSLTSSDEKSRSMLMISLGNVWDANETWLVLVGGTLFGAFPLAYATVLHALYIPVSMMVGGLILRAISFEFRENAVRSKRFWNFSFGIGSFLAALGQGFAVGTVFEGIAVDAAGHFVGGMWDWLNWRTLLVALTLIQGYVLIGSTYLVMKTTGTLQQTHYQTAKLAAVTTFLGAVFITASTPVFYEQIGDRIFEPPLFYFFVAIPLLGTLFVGLLLRSLYKEEERTPLFWTVLIFLLSFVGLGLIIFPYIIPPQITIYQAAASPSALVFMMIFTGFLIPIMLFYNIYNYVVFRGKITQIHQGD